MSESLKMKKAISFILLCALFLLVSFSSATTEDFPGNEVNTVGNKELTKTTLKNGGDEEKFKFIPHKPFFKIPPKVVPLKPFPPAVGKPIPVNDEKPLPIPGFKKPFLKPFPFVKKPIPKPFIVPKPIPLVKKPFPKPLPKPIPFVKKPIPKPFIKKPFPFPKKPLFPPVNP
ncbi:hypothetical protein QN277_002098 [Acacia crassicarpa]|uniref:Uncharacterized protein n=1 Tax=Acacia crassicarpa TaxID=499986 RepID=A0AAE1N8H1_9FABA|nr:hypothetical protein QN277_002098 [Acacia crassicarpa]